MINDDDRDYAEERANLADMRREAEAEAAHERLTARVVAALRTLSHNAHADAQESVGSLAGEVNLRQAPNVHRYELLARRQHTALLAATVAATIEDGVGYDLAGAARGVTTPYVILHTDGDLFGRAVRVAADRVVECVQSVLDADEQEQLDAREQADLDETHRSLR